MTCIQEWMKMLLPKSYLICTLYEQPWNSHGDAKYRVNWNSIIKHKQIYSRAKAPCLLRGKEKQVKYEFQTNLVFYTVAWIFQIMHSEIHLNHLSQIEKNYEES